MSATNMKLFLLLGFSLLLHHEIEGITSHSVTGCSDNVYVNCSITEMIHVERITYYNGTDCNQALTDLQVCGKPVTGIDTGLVPSCNGKISCKEIIYYNPCPGSKAAELDYRCIPRTDVKYICDEIIIDNVNRIFLSTPNYPLAPNFTGIISPFRCSIRGSSITSIQILELALTSDDGTKSSLEINYGDVTFKAESYSDVTRRVYNKRLPSTSTTAEIILNHAGSNRQYLWIEVQGVSMLGACTTAPVLTSTKLLPTTTTKTSTVQPTTSSSSSSSSSLPSSTSSSSTPSSSSSSSSSSSTFSSTSSFSPSSTSFPVSSSSSSSSSSSKPPSPTESFTSKQNQDNDKGSETIIAVSVVLSLCLLLICITLIVVCILFRKGKIVWVKKSPQVERERNPYSGLELNQRVAGRDGSYQEVNIRNSRSHEQGETNPYSGLDLNQRVAGNDGTYLELSTRNLRSPEEEGERNPYSGLDQAQRVAGNDGTYQELNTRNSRPQYHNVSRSTHPEYHNLN